MKNYELSYLINPELSEEEVKNLSQKITGYIQEEKGTVETLENPVRKRLGYPIKSKGTAYFISLSFYLKVENLASFQEKIKKEPEILRYILVNKKKFKPEAIRRQMRTKNREGSETEKPKEKVELKEIEKKLEEILGE